MFLDVYEMLAALFCNCALALSKLHRWQESIDCAREAVKLRPQWSKGHVRLVAALKGSGDFRSAYHAAVAADDANVTADALYDRVMNDARTCYVQKYYESDSVVTSRQIQSHVAVRHLDRRRGKSVFATAAVAPMTPLLQEWPIVATRKVDDGVAAKR